MECFLNTGETKRSFIRKSEYEQKHKGQQRVPIKESAAHGVRYLKNWWFLLRLLLSICTSWGMWFKRLFSPVHLPMFHRNPRLLMFNSPMLVACLVGRGFTPLRNVGWKLCNIMSINDYKCVSKPPVVYNVYHVFQLIESSIVEVTLVSLG